jgi:murein DD-endopeptidase MepM/ murein hydrolase activator NlpD
MPCQGAITNTHHNERAHDGIDLAAPMGTPVSIGPNGGYVSKAYTCAHCKPNGDGIASLNDASKAYGFGSHVVVRYGYNDLPPRIQAMIPRGAFLFAMHAHLSKVYVLQGQTLAPYHVIGEVGATGNSYGVDPWHLHWALHWSEDEDADFYSTRMNAIDPMLLIKGN